LTTNPITELITSPSADINSPFRVSSEDLQGRIDEEQVQETPSPAESATEGMNSVLWGHARRRTTSTVTPATMALSQSASKGNQPITPSPLSSVSSVFSSLTGGWRRKWPDSLNVTEGDGINRRSSVPRVREHTRAASSDIGAAGILRRFDASRE
jgi:hypothetical protein